MPDIKETEPNNSLEQFQAVEANCTINGTIGNEDVDVFQVTAKKGERLSVEIEAIRLGFMFDPFIAILNDQKFEIAVSDDSNLNRQDGVLSVVVPNDGTYFLLVRESSYGGNGNCRYRLHIGNFPRPTVAFPAGGKPGETLQVKFLGDPNGNIEQEIIVPATEDFRPGLFVQDTNGETPSPVSFRISDLENQLEVEPNADRKKIANVHAVPAAFNGIIETPNDHDYFKFKANKGQKFDVECYARRIRSGLDPVINIYNAKGKHLVGDDDARRPDCYLRFDVPETGEYFIRIRDHLNRGQADFVYRVEFQKLTPQLKISIPRVDRYSQLRQKICVAQGNRFATMISAERKNFGGAIKLQDTDWPAGVTANAKPMVANLNLMPVVFTAEADAVISGSLVDLHAQHVDDSKAINGSFSISADFALGPPNNSKFHESSVDKLAVAVTKKLPFKIDIVQPLVPLVRNGNINLKIIATRDEGFDDPINVQFPFRPPGLGTKPQVVIAKGETEVYYPLNANGSAQIGTWPVYAIGQADVGGPAWASTQLANLQISEAFVSMEMNRTTCSQGEEASIVCKLNHHQPFEGEATAELLGVPPNIEIRKRTFTKETNEIEFLVNTSDKSPVGKHKGLFCRVTVPSNGQAMVSTAARSELRINKAKPAKAIIPKSDAPKPPESKAAAKQPQKSKPKSRLQQLREAAQQKRK